MKTNLLVQVTLGCFMGLSVGCALDDSDGFDTAVAELDVPARVIPCNSTSDTWQPLRGGVTDPVIKKFPRNPNDPQDKDNAKRTCAQAAESTHVQPSRCEGGCTEGQSCTKDMTRFRVGPNNLSAETDANGNPIWVCKAVDHQGQPQVNMVVNCTKCAKPSGGGTGGTTAMASPSTGLVIPDYIYVTGGHAIAMVFDECDEPVEVALPLASVAEI